MTKGVRLAYLIGHLAAVALGIAAAVELFHWAAG